MTNMTHEQLVEKVSKAICMANCHNPDAVLTDNLDHSKWEIYVPDARAAIATIAEATKEPTEAMNVAGCLHDDPLGELVNWYGSDVTTRSTVAGVYKAMHAKSPLYPEGK